jgi:predicted metalloprotease with PDZ domain
MRAACRAAFCVLAMMPIPLDAGGVPPDTFGPVPVRYTVAFTSPATHVVEVEASIPAAGRPAVELDMPVWTPGSYLVREYARNVDGLTAEAGGSPAPVTKVAKNRWRIATSGAPEVTVRYRLYGAEMSVRNNYIDPDFALLNGAATFLRLLDDDARRPYEVTLRLPESWHTSVTPMPAAPGGMPHRYLAADFDTLVDSPIVAGNPVIHEFTVRGVPHLIVDVGGGAIWDGARTIEDVRRIVETAAAFWGVIPYDRYVFFNLLTGSDGGLEHKNACTLMTSRWKIRTRRGYVDWLTLVSHEFFHAWNVKRLRPVELGPFDYDRENPTRMLWVAEGLTSYYGDLLARRAGVITEEEYFRELGSLVTELQATPGRLSMPVEQASYDAWIRYYRPDENSPNVSVSYYTKGALIGLLLDVEIRRASGGARSLDDVMRAAWSTYSGARGYTPEDFRAVVSSVAGADLSAWLHRALDTTDELDFGTLPWLGIRLRAETSPQPRPWLGLSLGKGSDATLKADDGRLIVAQVRRGTPAEAAGLSAGDEILAIGGYRVLPGQWASRLEAWRPGDTVPVLVARREALLTLDVTFAEAPPQALTVEADPEATGPAAERRAAWLGR